MLELYFPLLKAIITEPKKVEIKPEPVAIVEEVDNNVDELDNPVDNVEEMIRQTFGEDSELALEIARCESGLDSTKYNPSGAKGIFQIMPVHEHRIKTGKDFFDAETNIQVAFEIYEEQKTEPWISSGECWREK